MQIRLLVVSALAGACVCSSLFASDPLPPQILAVGSSNAQKTVTWTPYPAANQYNILSTPNVAGVFTNDGSGAVSGFAWQGSNNAPAKFFKLGVTPMSSNALLSANILNRLAYGPSPDDLPRVLANPQAYIDEQLNFEGITETGDAYVTVTTNGVNPAPNTDWVYVTVSGRAAGTTRSNVYIYMTGVGDGYIDDLQLYAPTNTTSTTNLIVNGDFETPLAGTWTVSANLTGSLIDPNVKHSGNSSLHIVSTQAGTTQGSSIWQTVPPILSDGEHVVLSFWYLPGPN